MDNVDKEGKSPHMRVEIRRKMPMQSVPMVLHPPSDV